MKNNKQIMEEFVLEVMCIHEELKKKRIECDKANDMRNGRIIHESELTANQIATLANEYLSKMKG